MVNDKNINNVKSLVLRNYPPSYDKANNRILIDNGYTCYFCGFRHLKNRVDLINNSYIVVDHFCYFCLHVSLLNDEDAAIVFLPDLQREDVINLQRTIFFALKSENNSKIADAKNLHEWLLSHDKYIKDFFGTASFCQWKKFIADMTNNNSPFLLSGIHLIYKNFSIFDELYYSINFEYKNYSVERWNDMYAMSK